jgi:UrcA family protein
MTNIFTPATALGLCLFIALPAAAAPAPELPQAIVQTADLDLATPAGEKALHYRIATAVTQVCGVAGSRELAVNTSIKNCRALAWASTKPQLQTVLASARNGKAYSVASLTVTGPSRD